MTALTYGLITAAAAAALLAAVWVWRRARRQRLDRAVTIAGAAGPRGVSDPNATLVVHAGWRRRRTGHLVLGHNALVFMPLTPGSSALVVPHEAVVDAQVTRTQVAGEGSRAAIEVTWVEAGQHHSHTWVVDDPARWMVALSALSA